MTRLLNEPWVVNEESERISTHGGLGSIDFNGAEKERREAMRLVAQTQAMAYLLRRLDVSAGFDASNTVFQSEVKRVLRDGGILP